MSFALKIQNSCLQTFLITSWDKCSKMVVEIIHGYLQLHTFQKESSVETKAKSARVYFTGRTVNNVTAHWIARLSSFCLKFVLHSPSWKADSHTAIYPKITRYCRRFLAVFAGARHRILSWPLKTSLRNDPLCFFNIDTNIIFSFVPGL